MKHRIAVRVGMTACVGMTALGVAGTTSAQAQMVYVEPPPRVYDGPPPAAAEGGLPASEILMVVRSSGLRPLTQPARRGPRYVLLASDNMGGQLRVVVSAHDGRIIHAEPAYDPRFAYQPVRPRGLIPDAPPQHAAMPPPHPAPELREPTPPLPRTARTTAAPQPPAPPAKQDHRLASAPDTTGVRADTSGAHAAAASAARDRRERDRGRNASAGTCTSSSSAGNVAGGRNVTRSATGARGTERGAGNKAARGNADGPGRTARLIFERARESRRTK